MPLPPFLERDARPLLQEGAPPKRLTGLANTRTHERLNLSANVPLQEEDHWCWAAVTVGVACFFGVSSWRQCEIASLVLKRACCPPRSNAFCNVEQALEPPLDTAGHLNSSIAGSQSFAYVRDQLKANRPVCCRIQWRPTGGHFLVLVGITDNDTQYVDVSDPWYGPSTIAFPEFVSNYFGSGFWNWTYETKPRSKRRSA